MLPHRVNHKHISPFIAPAQLDSVFTITMTSIIPPTHLMFQKLKNFNGQSKTDVIVGPITNILP
jgi:hypothetical protein